MRCWTRLSLGLTCFLSAISLNSCKSRVDPRESEIKADEQVLFFPTAARWDRERQLWSIPIHGWIFEPEEDGVARRAAVSKLRTTLGLNPDQSETELFEQRVRWFIVDNERGKSVTIHFAGQEYTLDPSVQDGHFMRTIMLPDEAIDQYSRDGCVRFEAITKSKDNRSFSGVVHFPASRGVSVISDIDDTIKISEVIDKKKLLANTFWRPFHAVPGMPEKYRRWSESGAQFHYVSASPWQLYVPLSTFMQNAGFPGGTWHLKRFRTKDSSFWNLFEDPVAYKQNVIEELLQAFPEREFVLVGDSGEKDPEVYGILARRHPQQIVKVYIRDVTGDAADADRYQQAFEEVPSERWLLFQDPNLLMWPIPNE